MKPKSIYSLTSKNLTHLGGPMGTEYITTNWIEYFSTMEKAKAYAEKVYKGAEKIEWRIRGKHISSQDLGFVMYCIKKIEIIE